MGRCDVARRFFCIVSFVFALLAPDRSALALNPYETELSLKGWSELPTSTSSVKTFDSIPAVRFSGRMRGVGHVEGRFGIRRNKTWTSFIERGGRKYIDRHEPVLLRGRVAVGGGTVVSGRRVYPTGASIINKQLKITFPGRITGSRRSRQRVYTIRVSLDGRVRVSARVSSVPVHAYPRGACGSAVGAGSIAKIAHAEGDETPEHVISPIPTGTSTPVEAGSESGRVLRKIITISTDADPEWFKKYGELSNAVIAGFINTAEAMYDRQLGIRFRIIRQHVYADSSPYDTTDPLGILKAFTSNPSNRDNLGATDWDFHSEVDLKHLFTGKDLNGSVIGIAYIGTTCAAPALAYGVTQSYVEAAIPGIFAHELGHNMGAFHDVSDRKGLMYPSISLPPSERLSEASIDEISGHLSRHGACLSREWVAPRQPTGSEVPTTPTPTPTPTPKVSPPVETPKPEPSRITLRREVVGTRRESMVRLSGRVVPDRRGEVGPIKLHLVVHGATVAKVVTTPHGDYEFLVKFSLPRGEETFAYVETADGWVSSRVIWVSSTRRSRRR